MTLQALSHGADELALLSQARSGDRAAMQRLYALHGGRLYGLALRLVGNTAEAEDVVQETFVNAWRFGGSFRGDARLGSWLCRIALNESRAVLRKRRPTGADATEAEAGAVLPRDVNMMRRLEAALGKLPDGYREAIVLHDVMGMDHAEAADVLGVEVGTSKSQLHKARARMRQLLGDQK